MTKFLLPLILTLLTFTVSAQKDNAPHLDEIYYTNANGEKITGTVSVDDKIVIMVIQSRNALGEKVVIKMDEGENYFYKKKFLGAGSSFKFKITEDTQKITLEIYNPHNKKHVRRRKKSEGVKKAEDAKG